MCTALSVSKRGGLKTLGFQTGGVRNLELTPLHQIVASLFLILFREVPEPEQKRFVFRRECLLRAFVADCAR